MVVCSIAAPEAVAPICLISSGLKSQVLATAIRTGNEARGATVCNMAAPGPRKSIAKAWSLIAVTACDKATTPPPSAGGAEEWPPSALALTFSVA